MALDSSPLEAFSPVRILQLRMFFSLCILLIFCANCAGRSPKVDGDTKALGSIKEYEEKVAVKELPAEEQKTPIETKELVSLNQPKLGLEPAVKVEVKGKHRKKRKMEAPEETDMTGMTSATAEVIARKHLPETEDSEGFVGRRPSVDPFRVGEKITLMLTYFGVSAGDTTMEVKPFAEVNGRRAYHFYSEMKSSAVFSMFYKVDDYCESFLDYEEMVPLNFTLSATETKQIKEVRQFFDWKNRKADYWERRVTKEDGVQEKKRSWDLEPYSQNIYTAVQYIRTFQLQDGKTYIYHVSDDGRTWDVKATVLRREILKTDLGNFKSVVIKPEVFTEGILKPMGEVLFWYSDDDRKFPIKFESKIKIGKVIGYLKGMEKGAP